jgi:hypothetical protein
MKLFSSCCFLFSMHIIYAQYSFSVKNLNQINMETKELISTIAVNQFFNFSLKDGFMVHNLIDSEGNIEDSQFYKIIKKEKKKDLIWLSCKSGVSGNIYRYFISEGDETGTQLFQYLEENTVYQMEGEYGKCKTFNQ